MNSNPYLSAIEMLRALANREISSVELAQLHIDRIERFDELINAVVVRDFERALDTAHTADKARLAGADGALLGLPTTVKDAFFVEGLPATGGGIPERAGLVADWDSPAVEAIKRAGGIILGKTNMPPYAADHKSENPLYGRTSNPWDLTRTPGGSSGGAAAALAAGMTPLEIGGDYAGSIRVPSAFCGVFGHKSSETVGPGTGHFPVEELPNSAFSMAVQGPMARTAADLQLLFEVLTGSQAGAESGWRLALSAPRARRLSDFRVAVLPRFDWLPLEDAIAGMLDEWLLKLADTGAKVATIDPFEGDFIEYTETYLRIFFSQTSGSVPPHAAARIADQLRSTGDRLQSARADGCLASASDYLSWFHQREVYRERLREFFQDWDILLAPCTITNAFPHTAWAQDDEYRYLEVNGSNVSSIYLFPYPGLCTLSGHPGTAFPAGQTAAGLPIGLQAIGPYLEDRTTIRFAALIEDRFGGFAAPVDYRS